MEELRKKVTTAQQTRLNPKKSTNDGTNEQLKADVDRVRSEVIKAIEKDMRKKVIVFQIPTTNDKVKTIIINEIIDTFKSDATIVALYLKPFLYGYTILRPGLSSIPKENDVQMTSVFAIEYNNNPDPVFVGCGNVWTDRVHT